MNNSQIKNNKINLIIFILISLSFLIGFVLNEDSSGGGALDFKHEVVSINEFKNGIFDALSSIKYESSRMPLFLIINAFNPFSDNIQNINVVRFK